MTRNVRQAAFGRLGCGPIPPHFPVFLSRSLRPLFRLRCKGRRSERDLVNGIRAVRRSSRRATSRLLVPSEIKASRGACRDEQTELFEDAGRDIRLIVYLYFSVRGGPCVARGANHFIARLYSPPRPKLSYRRRL